MAARDRHSVAGAGFTILELLLVMAIVAALTVVLSMGIKRVRNSDLRADITGIAQSLRTAAAMATRSGTHHRVVFDLEQRTYRIEACTGTTKLRRGERAKPGDDEESDQDRAKIEQAMELLEGGGLGAAAVGLTSEFTPEIQSASSPEDAAAKARALAGVRLGAGRCAPPTRVRGGKEGPDPRGKVRKLTRDDQFDEIWVQHLEDPVKQEGIVTINFFPLGYAEKAVVIVKDADDDMYTLLVHGLTGRIEFKDGRWRTPEEHMMRDGRGRAVEAR